jgi:hypothetical protein
MTNFYLLSWNIHKLFLRMKISINWASDTFIMIRENICLITEGTCLDVLDKFRFNQAVRFGWKAELTGIENWKYCC